MAHANETLHTLDIGDISESLRLPPDARGQIILDAIFGASIDDYDEPLDWGDDIPDLPRVTVEIRQPNWERIERLLR